MINNHRSSKGCVSDSAIFAIIEILFRRLKQSKSLRYNHDYALCLVFFSNDVQIPLQELNFPLRL